MTAALRDMAGRKEVSRAARMGRGVAWALLVLLMIVTLFPFYWALRTALTTNPDLFAPGGAEGLLPPDPTDVNFKRVLGRATDAEIQEGSGRENSASFDYLLGLKNSVIIATVIAIGQVFFSALAAYALARLKFKGREAVFFMFIAGMMLPPIFILIPNLLLMRDMPTWLFGDANSGWLNTYQGAIAPFFLMTPFAVFFLRQFFLSINRSLEEAALIDGANHFRIFRSVILPIASPQLVTMGVLAYVTAWNEFFWPFVVAKDPEVAPLTVTLNAFSVQQPGTQPDWSGLMSGTLLAALPVILIFAAFGRRIVDSIQFSGIK